METFHSLFFYSSQSFILSMEFIVSVSATSPWLKESLKV